MTKLRTFLDNVFAPGLHVAFAFAWVASLVGSLVLLREPAHAWRLDPPLLLAGLSVLLVLFYLRVLDEVKDYDYDVVHNPDRLLVQGAVSHADLRRWALGSGLVVLALNTVLGVLLTPWLLFIVFLDLVWAIALIALERRSTWVADSMFVNLVVTYPVNVALSAYLYVFTLAAYQLEPQLSDAWLLGAFVLVFLHYEFARKTAWPELSAAGEKLYSNVLGARGALVAILCCAWSAVGACLYLFRPWEHLSSAPLRALAGASLLLLPALTLVMARKLLSNRSERKKLGGLGMIGLTVFYAALTAQALLANRLALGGA